MQIDTVLNGDYGLTPEQELRVEDAGSDIEQWAAMIDKMARMEEATRKLAADNAELRKLNQKQSDELNKAAREIIALGEHLDTLSHKYSDTRKALDLAMGEVHRLRVQSTSWLHRTWLRLSN